MKILITGATGYVCQNFIPELIIKNPDVEILTINLSVEEAEKLLPFQQCKHISTKEIDKVVDFNPELIYHLATLSSSRNDAEIIHPMIEANIEFGVRLLNALSNCKDIRLFVNFGSFAEYRLGPQKISDAYLYTATKSAFRHFVEYYSNLAGFKHINLVPYTIYGGKDTAKKLIDYIQESLTSEQPVKMTKGEQILDFIHVKDIASFLVLISEKLEQFQRLNNGEEFHLGTGRGTQVRELAGIIEKKYKAKCNIDWGGIPYRALDTMFAVAPIAKNIEQLNWRAKISLEEGLILQ